MRTIFMTVVGSLTTRQCYYKGVYLINPNYCLYICIYDVHITHIIIIIIIKRGWQCKAGRERLTPYQSEDPNPTTPTHRKKEEKGKQ